ncbi:enoyl-CoA hydratase-related protein [uncultured Albimonas sp.]|uniref:enoyl-CoA hydratase/isomerase family protein n=1 Tax=uncultured Albimonas sp. TaxID=1331701 RepID=UPI0030EF770A|tara:strand:+ start:2074 stop:2886 length:813 start_codon:yes stop_codon:yes gene_type:complete
MSGLGREGPGFATALDAGVLTLTLNRPEARNPFVPGMPAALRDLLGDAQADPAVRCLLVRGAGDHLSAGGDVASFARSLAETTDAERQAEFRGRMAVGKALALALAAFDRPVVVRHRGAVAGAGLMVPLAADLVVADETARFVFAYRRLALSPDGGVSWLLARAVGARQARRLMLTAAVVEAPEAQRLGLIDLLVPAEELDAAAARAAADFATAPQGSLRRIKRLADAAPGRDYAAHLDAEGEAIVEGVVDPDFAEGVAAFLEKRPPRFA